MKKKTEINIPYVGYQIPNTCWEKYIPEKGPGFSHIFSKGLLGGGINRMGRGYKIGHNDHPRSLLHITIEGSGRVMGEGLKGYRKLGPGSMLIVPVHVLTCPQSLVQL